MTDHLKRTNDRLQRGDEFRGYAFKVGNLYVHRDDPTRLTPSKKFAERRHDLGEAWAYKRSIVG